LPLDLLIIVGTVLAAAIRVKDAALWWRTERYRHFQCPDRQVSLHPIADSPPTTRQWFALANHERAITRRECKSKITARYNQPSRVQT